MKNFRTYYVGKVITYNNIEGVKAVEDIKTLAAGPSKDAVADLTIETIEKFFPEVALDGTKETLMRGKKIEFPENGYIFEIDEVKAVSILEVL